MPDRENGSGEGRSSSELLPPVLLLCDFRTSLSLGFFRQQYVQQQRKKSEFGNNFPFCKYNR